MCKMKNDFTFKSENLTFTPIGFEDAEIIVKWRSNPENIKYFKNKKPITLQEHLHWYKNVYLKSQLCVHFIISTSCSNKKIGTLSLNFTDGNCNSCYVGYGVFEENEQKKGYGKESLLALINMVANNYNCFSFIAEIHQDNLSSINLALKCGFEKEVVEDEFITFVLNYEK